MRIKEEEYGKRGGEEERHKEGGWTERTVWYELAVEHEMGIRNEGN